MTEQSLWKTKEWVWLAAMLVVCSIAAFVLIQTIPTVNKLPDGTSTAIEYVVNATVARFGVPVVAFLFLAAVATTLGHNGGAGRPRLEFFAKVCSFGAATFSLWAVAVVAILA
jgi:hypothetical protein